ncbi:hypothetical protein M5689_011276 [Euphorbia peplus]|nr:hypothetical protein M5689_011276 [Euphorbia peplus]
MFRYNDIENQEVEEEEEEEEEEMAEKQHEIFEHLIATIQAILYMLSKVLISMSNQRIQRSLTRRPISSRGYDYIHAILNEDPAHFRQVYRMYPDVFLKLCKIIRENTFLQDTRFICIEEMLASFLLIIGQNSRYCLVRKTFNRSHFSISQSFNKILRGLNKIAVDMMAKPSNSIPEKIRESTRFFPYFKDCIGAMDGTHIPAMVSGRDTSSYRSAHDSKVLSDAISRNNGLKVPQGKYFLVDCGFPNRLQFLAPFRDEFPVEEDSEISSSSVNPTNQEEDFEPFIIETQEQQRETANTWRNGIANDMWRDVENMNNME